MSHRFEIWAPRPRTVELLLDSGRLAMARRDDGWWVADVDGVGHGTRYGFSLDGGPMRPDPRSEHQPDGLAGPSALVDHARFEWHDAHWAGVDLADAVLYELHVGTFSATGTLDGAIPHLPHLVELGIDAVELLPVAEASGTRGWGYDGVHLFAVHHAYGGPEALKRFVDACHGHGLAVVMDVVYNHLGPVGNHLAELGPYFTDRHVTPWGDAVNLDGPGAAEVRAFVVDNARLWLRDHHCDGLRLDAVHALVDDSPVHILRELREAVGELAEEVGRRLFVVAESDANDRTLVTPVEQGGHGLDAVWSDDWHHAVHVALTGETDGYYVDHVDDVALATALRQAWVLDGGWSHHRGRAHGTSPAGLPPERFVVCTQNHDQVGNRATGDRSSALVGPARLRVAAALLLTSPFVPMLFQGEEWGATSPFLYFTDHEDPDLATAVRDGRRREFAAFGWDPSTIPDPQDPLTFERSRLDWAERSASPHRELLAWHRTLIDLRRRLRGAKPANPPHVTVDDGLVVVDRGVVAVHANLGPAPAHVVLDPERTHLVPPGQAALDEVGSRVALPVDSVVVSHLPFD
jgi:maltooligosyltrehalose trehalohydrolase